MSPFMLYHTLIIQIAAINQPTPPPPPAGTVAAAAGPSPVAQRKAWDKPVMVQLPKQYDATTSVVQGVH